MKKSIIFAVILILLLSFCACSDNSKQATTSVVGKYMLSKYVSKHGEVMTGEEYDRDEFSITLKEDGTGTIISEGDVSAIFTWKQSGSEILVTYQGMQTTIQVNGNSIVLKNEDGSQMTFTR